jgi:hypothetical protein
MLLLFVVVDAVNAVVVFDVIDADIVVVVVVDANAIGVNAWIIHRAVAAAAVVIDIVAKVGAKRYKCYILF